MLKYAFIAGFLSLTFSTAAHAGDKQYDMRVDGLTCPFCVATSTKALKKIEGVTEVAIDLDAGLISVCAANETDLNDTRMKKLFRKKGFTYRSQTVADNCPIGDSLAIEDSDKTHGYSADDGHDHSEYGSAYGSGEGYGSGTDDTSKPAKKTGKGNRF